MKTQIKTEMLMTRGLIYFFLRSGNRKSNRNSRTAVFKKLRFDGENCRNG